MRAFQKDIRIIFLWTPKEKLFNENFTRYDWRLSFVNLKNNSMLNAVNEQDQTRIWIPNLVFENSPDKKYIANEALSTLSIKKEGSFERSFNFELNEFEEFDGAVTPVVYGNTLDLKLMCELELHFYPFDTQNCYIKVRGSCKIKFDIMSTDQTQSHTF